MRTSVVCAVALSVAAGLASPAQQTSSGTQTPAGGQQPPKPEIEKPRSQVPTLGRPTKPDDPAPLLDFIAYFKGSWAFTWNYPDSPLGPAGVLSGTTSYRQIDEKFFEAVTEAEGAGGTVRIREVIGYLRDRQTLARTVTDSRGFTYTQIGTVGGDLGGQFTIRFEGSPFTHNGRTIRLNSVMRLLSPLNYRTQTTISIDEGPFTNFGNPWWKKSGATQ